MLKVFFLFCILVGLAYLLFYIVSDLFEDKTVTKNKIEPLKKQQDSKVKKALPMKREQIYYLQIDRVKYLLYPYNNLCDTMRSLYEMIVVGNLWINEPFHSKFYQILLLMDKNELMIPDPQSRILTLHLRDSKGEVHKSKSYQVFSTQKIIEYVLNWTMTIIRTYEKNDAQNIVIAICVIALEKSVHYLAQGSSKKVLDNILDDYEYVSDIKQIINLFNIGNGFYRFIQIAFQEAYISVRTEPYNDNQIQQRVQMVYNLPKKVLQEI